MTLESLIKEIEALRSHPRIGNCSFQIRAGYILALHDVLLVLKEHATEEEAV
jgi:hypothetical protein